jgi:CMP-N-acetylneuraminic acid synthetase
MNRDELLKEIVELLHNDSDFPKFDTVVVDSDGTAVINIADKEFMIMVVDVTE